MQKMAADLTLKEATHAQVTAGLIKDKQQLVEVVQEAKNAIHIQGGQIKILTDENLVLRANLSRTLKSLHVCVVDLEACTPGGRGDSDTDMGIGDNNNTGKAQVPAIGGEGVQERSTPVADGWDGSPR